ncbi:ABC transporter permease [Rhodobacteraceae bacterium HSP-20]|uniref:Spermidine/putrescine transport system permease protein PotC n=1 Tax=Paragemmobacter amnigenus TaxID=2852097 RepID=A0ABS6IXS1_9RHOB|nr:ABC transporter permease [Rhodobacter amnigenus]MBU9696308.1 ABC transporter permease [Rhodobacter amnigenus]MBV4387535.1 ABC transporter permease [Rhodobacter amnigenus]
MVERGFDIRRLPGAATLAIACFVILYIPMVILVVNSLNGGQSISLWEGVSLRWYAVALQNEGFLNAAKTSLILATTAALVATVTATMAALATTRSRGFRGEGAINLILNQPLMVPEIVLAIALLIILAQIKQATGYMGLGYLVVAHSAFCIPFAYMPIRARLQGMDLTLETAAADLYASRFYTFRKVTLPLLAPAILAGFMLAFVVSLDDVVISEFLKSPGQDTLPTYLLGQLKRNLTSEIYAISSLLLLISVLIVAGSWLLTRKKT